MLPYRRCLQKAECEVCTVADAQEFHLLTKSDGEAYPNLFGTASTVEDVRVAKTLGYTVRTTQAGGHYVAIVAGGLGFAYLCDSLKTTPFAVPHGDIVDLLKVIHLRLEQARSDAIPVAVPSGGFKSLSAEERQVVEHANLKNFEECGRCMVDRVFLAKP